MADIPKWPARLPVPAAPGYGYQSKAPFVRTEMDAGTARSRRRFRVFPKTVSVSYTFSGEEMEVFEAFVHYEIFDGAAQFETPLATAAGLVNVKASFTQDPPYNVALVAGSLDLWKVTAQLETLELPVATFARYYGLTLGADTIINLANQLDHANNVVLPGAE